MATASRSASWSSRFSSLPVDGRRPGHPFAGRRRREHVSAGQSSPRRVRLRTDVRRVDRVPPQVFWRLLAGGLRARRLHRPLRVRQIAQCISQIKPDRVQLHTVSRPPAEPCAIGAPLVRRTGPGERRGAHESRQIFQAALDLAASDNKTYFVWLPSWSSADCGKSRGPPVNTSTVTVRVSRPLRWDCCAEKTPFRSMRMSLPLRYL